MEINSIHLLTQAVKAAKAAAVFWSKERQISDIVKDLRFLRFDDDGVLSLIDAIVRGETGKIDELKQRLVPFNDHEWRVADTAARLLERCDKVSNLTNEELELIGWRKPDVRRQIQSVLNRIGRPGAKFDVDELAKIRAGIDDLNRAIDDAEDKLLHGTRM